VYLLGSKILGYLPDAISAYVDCPYVSPVFISLYPNSLILEPGRKLAAFIFSKLGVPSGLK
jgi:hypothetical protein